MPMWSECAWEKGYGHSYPDNIEVICKSEIMTSERKINEHAFACARGKHAMHYTHHRGLSGVTRWFRLSYAAINLKSWKIRASTNSILRFHISCHSSKNDHPLRFFIINTQLYDRLKKQPSIVLLAQTRTVFYKFFIKRGNISFTICYLL